MLLLTSTSDIIRIVTGSAVSTIGVHASWVDNASGAITPGRTNTNITTATTTTVVASPSASTQRNVRALSVTNNNASASTQVTIQHFDGTTSTDLKGVTLLAGENMILDEDGSWHHHDSQGAEYAPSAPVTANLGATGTLAETMPRMLGLTTNTTAGASGTLFMQAIYLTAGTLVSNIEIISATTAQVAPTHYWFALYDGSRNLLANSADQTTTVWAANTAKKLAMGTPYRIPTSGLYYIGLAQVVTTTQATIAGGPAQLNATSGNSAPILHGTSTTGITTALPNPAAAITAGTASIYAAIS